MQIRNYSFLLVLVTLLEFHVFSVSYLDIFVFLFSFRIIFSPVFFVFIIFFFFLFFGFLFIAC